jgi:hypothetical protein
MRLMATVLVVVAERRAADFRLSNEFHIPSSDMIVTLHHSPEDWQILGKCDLSCLG